MALRDDIAYIAIIIIYSPATLQRWSGAKKGKSCDYRRHYLGGGGRLDKNVTQTRRPHLPQSFKLETFLCMRVCGDWEPGVGSWSGVTRGLSAECWCRGELCWPPRAIRKLWEMAWLRGQAFYVNTDHTGGQQSSRGETSSLFARLWWIIKITVHVHVWMNVTLL